MANHNDANHGVNGTELNKEVPRPADVPLCSRVGSVVIKILLAPELDTSGVKK